MTQTVLLGDILYPVSETMKFTDEKVIFLNTSDIEAGKFLHKNLSDPKTLPGQAKKKIQKDDILFSEIRPANKRFAYVDFSDTELHVISTKLMVLRSNEIVYPKYAYHWLTAPQQLEQLQTIAESRSGTFPQITFDTIKTLKVKLPDYPEQVKIAEFIDSIDEKIELNRQMNETLEQMGQALFRHYFIDNPEAEKWKETTVDEYVDHLKTSVSPMRSPDTIFHQYSIPAYDNSFSSEVSRGDTIKSGKYKVEPKSILVSKLNPATPRIWAILEPKENAICSTEFQVIVPKKYYAFCYFLLTSKSYSDKMAMSAGGTSNSHRRIKPSDILSYSFAKPNDEVLQAFEQQAMTLLEIVEQNHEQIQTLTLLRDTFLPRLISGKIEV